MPGTSRHRDRSIAPDPDEASPGAARAIVVCVLLLFALSITMLYSIGIGGEDPLHYPGRQLIYAGVAFCGCVFTVLVPPMYWKKLMVPLVVLTVLLLLMARLVGRDIAGAHRWLSLGPVNFQPSELAKLSSILWVSYWLSRYRRRAAEFARGFFLPGAGLGVICVCVLIGPDFGTTMLIGGAGILIMFIGGTRIIYLFLSGMAAVGGLAGLLIFSGDKERLSRITSFLHPERYANDDAFQLMASLLSFINGGLFGEGIGGGLQKYDYLPEAHTDFILAILAEELGLIGVGAVILLYVTLFFCGMRIASRCKDPFCSLTGFGITAMLSLQAAINIGVVTGSMPTKGLPLPFVSYGGSSLVFSAAMIGILLRISKGNCGGKESDARLRDGSQWL